MGEGKAQHTDCKPVNNYTLKANTLYMYIIKKKCIKI